MIRHRPLDLGKSSTKSYSTYSRNLILPSAYREDQQARLKDGDGASSKLNNKNIFLKRAIYNFIKASVNNIIPGVHFQDSTTLITFLNEFDPNFKMSRQSVHNYKKRKLVFKGFLVNTDVSRFFAYVNSRFPEFNSWAFCRIAREPAWRLLRSQPNMAGYAGLLKLGFARNLSSDYCS